LLVFGTYKRVSSITVVLARQTPFLLRGEGHSNQARQVII
jgi:hypothetical protein